MSGAFVGAPYIDPGSRKAGAAVIVLYLGIPPVAGFGSASWFLEGASRVPWVIGWGMLLATLAFVATGPLGRLSEHFRIGFYRRAAEAMMLVGLTAVAAVAYAVGPYWLLGFDRPWARDLIGAVFGG